MRESRANLRIPVVAPLGGDNVAPTSFQWYGALALALTLVVITLLGVLFGREQGPQVKPILPLAAGIWSLAELLTAFLLLAQFYVNGRRFFGLVAVAYAITGLITWPYLIAFPGIFATGPSSVADQQISIYLWSIWHCTFPILVTCAAASDSVVARVVSRKAIRAATAMFVAAPVILVIASATLVTIYRSALPPFISQGHFVPHYRVIFLPAISALNGIACIVLLRPSRLSPLKVCLALAAFSATLDAALNLSANLYSYAWDASKLVTVFTASVVLFMMLCDIAEVYGRLERFASVDVLTSLANRRAFDQHVKTAFHHARRTGGSMSLLVIDIDFFKRINDSFGHAAGDECLRQVARAIVDCVTRPLDLVARFGGEEFVVVVPDTPLNGVFTLAERIRSVVQELEISHEVKPIGSVTVSIGIGDMRFAGTMTEQGLFGAADRALYEAKCSGRNRVVLGSSEPADAPLLVPSAGDLGFAPD